MSTHSSLSSFSQSYQEISRLKIAEDCEQKVEELNSLSEGLLFFHNQKLEVYLNSRYIFS